MPPKVNLLLTETHESSSVEQTEQIAAALAATLVGGEVIALHGDLGAGKTQFVRGLVRGLGGDPLRVSSPTYVLLHIYAQSPESADAMRLAVFHLDAYRVGGADDFEAIGFSELLEQGGVVVVEWPSRVAELLPSERIEVRIEPTGESARRITISR
ncbi:tRNA (adenosine(37)-N6)-threonylcarbamoyltransferase complex ATPase subunit type 1 TsaE [Humisphaera borealis]|uniref:tRNA threonylcarbamoyladenosine biosynthesis protein TsaE n=1 Tax=Humisphaera borealis TaxID=2807512 RepID=A0A7M2WSU3_9BACT|nr:tRNA (adenosine(37)-N6)-threonylcarbamoyltransferase complex ATPase subunit type 1 TsaE [Humisphaera borealis]QOV88595.1 tRNA (adenosine(37)-N6)-threonylcarbamoyltransferase complex ATPase subunit type 1 TsaE [Humisphaera borealis]